MEIKALKNHIKPISPVRPYGIVFKARRNE